jgi:RNA polymerase sigma-70 factor (ECF subfamily)
MGAAATGTLAITPSRPLLPLVAAGDEGAMRQVVRHFTPLVKTVARRTGAEPSVTDDLVQETMLRLWRFAHRFDPERGSEPTFVAAVARHAAIDLARRRACRPEAATADIDAVTDTSRSPMEQAATALTVRSALAGLSPAQRELIRLAYYERLTHAEIAERLGVPIGTVKSRTFQAIKTLRGLLREDADA